MSSVSSSTKLQLSPYDLETQPVNIHFLPCKIDHEGPAPVDTYFLVESLTKREPDSNPELLVATFRGRRLLGLKEKVPEGAHGLLLNADYEFDEMSDNEIDEMDDAHVFGCDSNNGRRVLRVGGVFNEITHWQQDQAPNNENHVPRWLEFVKLARAVHEEN